MNCNERRFYRCPPPAAAPQEDVPSRPSAAFLMQRILASGQLHRRCQCYPVCLNDLPPQACPPYTVTDVFLCGEPKWREDGCSLHFGTSLEVTLPVAVRVRDGDGRAYVIAAQIEECLRLRPECPRQECWRGQIYLQAAVRLANRCHPCDGAQCAVPMEVLLSGYLLCACPSRPMGPGPCADPRPWYPQPICKTMF